VSESNLQINELMFSLALS